MAEVNSKKQQKGSSGTWGGARRGAGRPKLGKKQVLIRITPKQQVLLNALGGSSWISRRLHGLFKKNIYVFSCDLNDIWSLNIMTGEELYNQQLKLEKPSQDSDTEKTVYTEKAEALKFIDANQELFQSSVNDWIAMIENS